MSEMIKVKNMLDAQCGYNIPDLRYRRVFTPGRVIPIPKEELEAAMYDPGVEEMFRMGVLKVIDDAGTGIAEQANSLAEGKVLEEKEVADLLTKKQPVELFNVLKEASKATKELIVTQAIKLEVMDKVRTGFIQKATGVDVPAAVLKLREANSPDK